MKHSQDAESRLGPRWKRPPPPARADRLKIFTLFLMEQWLGFGLVGLICAKWYYRVPFQRAGTCLVDTEQKSSLWQVVLHDYVTCHLQKVPTDCCSHSLSLTLCDVKTDGRKWGWGVVGAHRYRITSSSYLLVFVRAERIWLKFSTYFGVYTKICPVNLTLTSYRLNTASAHTASHKSNWSTPISPATDIIRTCN